MYRLIALLLPVAIMAATGTTTTSKPAELGKIWAASVQAEKNQNYPEAIQKVSLFMQGGGDAFMGSLRTGWLQYLSADYAKSERAYSKAAQLQPSSINALLGVLNATRAQLDPIKAERAAMAVLRVEASNYTALLAVAGLHYAAADYRKSASAYRRLLVTYPDDADGLSGAAWSSLNLGDKSAALADFSRLLSISPEYPLAQVGYEKAGGR
jgi:tetratricopeptide (TPR) repeat protein